MRRLVEFRSAAKFISIEHSIFMTSFGREPAKMISFKACRIHSRPKLNIEEDFLQEEKILIPRVLDISNKLQALLRSGSFTLLFITK